MIRYLEDNYENIIFDAEYIYCVKDILKKDTLKQMNEYIQHGTTTTLDHSINVSYTSFLLARKLNMDFKSVARAGLLHDLFLYDWHLLPKEKNLFKKHGFTHSTKALQNALLYFELNELEKDIIYKHMWPLTLRKIPKYKETLLVCLVDKYVSCRETITPRLKKVSDYLL